MNPLRIIPFSFLLLLSSFMPTKCQTDLSPRKLTIPEVKSNKDVQLSSLMTPITLHENPEEKFLSSLSVPLSHIPKGTNIASGPRDALR